LPEKLDPIDVGRGFPRWQRRDRPLAERIAFSHGVAGGGHGGNDLVGNRVSSAVAEPARQPASDGAVSAVQQLAEQIGGVADHRQGGAGVGCLIYKIPRRSFDQRSLQSVQAQPIPFDPVSGRGQRRLEVEKRRSVRQLCHAIGAFG
jgi:hypothetical protein